MFAVDGLCCAAAFKNSCRIKLAIDDGMRFKKTDG